MFYEVVLCIVCIMCWPWMGTSDSYSASAGGNRTLTIFSSDMDGIDCGLNLGQASNNIIIIDMGSSVIFLFAFSMVLGMIGISLVLPSIVLWEHILIDL